LTLLINGGYDVTQLQLVSNKIDDRNYRENTHSVLHNLGDPFPRIRKYGWERFLRQEVLPLNFSRYGLQWLPNYGLHLIGGGMLYTRMKEWYEERNFPAPWLLSSVTVMTQHLLNEIIETGEHEVYSVDEISDIYLFDLGGIVLFSFDNINEFFSKELNLADWSLQASIALPSGRLNAGQYFIIKWQLPFWKDYSFFWRYGVSALFGLSTKITPDESISAGFGFKSKHLIDLSQTIRDRTIATSWHTGVFWDRNNSLLASLVVSGVSEYFIYADVYPGVIKIGNFSPGIWTIIGRNGNFTMGFTTRWLIGAGYANY
jgi:hypothetical protein